ncbi:MAG: TetR family transcriptional regulator [Nocardiopsaceae bacterium]|nr:TetR family transcriptional regulator [Nocardiopsaceae bacterium]
MDHPDTDDVCAGRVRDKEATRQRILDSARELFTSEGYAQVSSRRIAAHAGVNVALINRYFGAKRGLLAEIIANEAVFPGIVEGDPATLPRRLAEYIVHHTLGGGSLLQRALEQSAGDPDLWSIHQERLENAVVQPLADSLDGHDTRVRASLAVSLMLGIGLLRRLEVVTSLAEYGSADLVERLTRIIEACLAETSPEA